MTSEKDSSSSSANVETNSPKTRRKKSPKTDGKPVGKKAAAKRKVTKTKIAKPVRPYPRVTLKEALEVAIKIKELNGGNPWDPEDLARALGMGPRSSKVFYVTAASRDFGLTLGTRDTAKIELTDLGRDVAFAPNPDAEQAKKVEAFLRIDIFKRVLEHYKGSQLPEMKYLGNTLQKDFGLDPEFHEEFSQVFRQNCQELGIESGISAQGNSKSSGNGVSSPSTVVLAEPKGKTNLKAFVIMPFVERNDDRAKGFFAEVLRSLVTPAAVEAGFKVETANRQGSDVIQSTIINDLLDADLVIADLTDHNPNVLFELGVRMAEDKPVALIKATGTGRVFDVDNMLRVYEYNGNLWHSTLDKDLPSLCDHIKGAWEQRNSHTSYIKILRKGGV